MKVYHGSWLEVAEPDLKHSRADVDFGKGFYTTPINDYDIVMGGVANDKVFNTVELYFDNLIDKKEAIKRLRYEKPNMQICFRTEAALKQLHFEGSVEV